MEALVAQVLIRNLDDETVAVFKAKARLHGRSLEQELRLLIESSRPFTTAERLAMAAELQGMPTLPHDFDVCAAIRFGRDDESLADGQRHTIMAK
jgi:plasmid stability protein